MSDGVGGGPLKWLNAAGSLASLIALGYVWHLFGPESRRDRPAGLTFAGIFGSSLGAPRISYKKAKAIRHTLPRSLMDCDYTSDLLQEGMMVELEHRGLTHGDHRKTAMIAAAHLCEDSRYYKALARMERGLKRRK